VNQIAEAEVNSPDGMLEVHSATIGVLDGTSGELPACRLRRVSQYIQENLQRELRLAELGALVHMSPYHFARLFKRSTGVPPHRFVVRRRIDEARALLSAGTVPIAEIARLVGFRTTSHFTTTFRRITGMTPGRYRGGAGAAGGRSTSVAATADAFDVIRGAVIGGAGRQTIGCRVDGS
jgi:AraC-like DNA-binding protein